MNVCQHFKTDLVLETQINFPAKILACVPMQAKTGFNLTSLNSFIVSLIVFHFFMFFFPVLLIYSLNSDVRAIAIGPTRNQFSSFRKADPFTLLLMSISAKVFASRLNTNVTRQEFSCSSFQKAFLMMAVLTVLSSQKNRYVVSVDQGQAFSFYLHVKEI